jgi:hypothetical protein
MSEILKLAGALAKANIPRDLSDEIAQALAATVAAEAKAVEDRMNKDVELAIERARADNAALRADFAATRGEFATSLRQHTIWTIATIAAGIGLVLAVLKLA